MTLDVDKVESAAVMAACSSPDVKTNTFGALPKKRMTGRAATIIGFMSPRHGVLEMNRPPGFRRR